MIKSIKRALCNHKYREVATCVIDDSVALFYECSKCGNRKAFLDNGYFSEFSKYYINKAKMWTNYQYDLTTKDITSNTKDIEFLERCLNE